MREAHERVSCIEELSLGHDAGRRQDHMPHKPGSKAAAETVRKHNKVASCSTPGRHCEPRSVPNTRLFSIGVAWGNVLWVQGVLVSLR